MADRGLGDSQAVAPKVSDIPEIPQIVVWNALFRVANSKRMPTDADRLLAPAPHRLEHTLRRQGEADLRHAERFRVYPIRPRDSPPPNPLIPSRGAS